MTSLAKKDFLDDPLDNVELAASIQNWTYDRSDNEVSIIANGKHNNYQLSVSLRNDSQGLDIVCGFDLRFNEKTKFVDAFEIGDKKIHEFIEGTIESTMLTSV